MRGLVLKSVIGLFVVVAYVASPFYAAWTLREAIRTADTETISRKVDFDKIRSSLRASIAHHADLYPIALQEGRAVKPSLWQRVKSIFGNTMLDRFIETYVTPEGLPKLFKARQSLLEMRKSGGLAPIVEAAADAGWRDKLKGFVSRLKRAEFHSLTAVEIELADRLNPDRHYVSLLELVGFEWKLVSLKVVKPASAALQLNRIARAN